MRGDHLPQRLCDRGVLGTPPDHCVITTGLWGEGPTSRMQQRGSVELGGLLSGCSQRAGRPGEGSRAAAERGFPLSLCPTNKHHPSKTQVADIIWNASLSRGLRHVPIQMPYPESRSHVQRRTKEGRTKKDSHHPPPFAPPSSPTHHLSICPALPCPALPCPALHALHGMVHTHGHTDTHVPHGAGCIFVCMCAYAGM